MCTKTIKFPAIFSGIQVPAGAPGGSKETRSLRSPTTGKRTGRFTPLTKNVPATSPSSFIAITVWFESGPVPAGMEVAVLATRRDPLDP